MSTDGNAPVSREITDAEKALNTGNSLFRLYVIDVDSSPDEPVIKQLFKKGDVYQEIQKRVRAILGSDGAEGDFIYADPDCTELFEIEEGSNWYLAQVRKQRSGKAGGVDKEWLRILMGREDLTPEQKLAEIAKYT